MRRHVNPFDGIAPGSKYRHELPKSLIETYGRVYPEAPGAQWRRWRIEHRTERTLQRRAFSRAARAFCNAGLCVMPKFSPDYYDAVADFITSKGW